MFVLLKLQKSEPSFIENQSLAFKQLQIFGISEHCTNFCPEAAVFVLLVKS